VARRALAARQVQRLILQRLILQRLIPGPKPLRPRPIPHGLHPQNAFRQRVPMTPPRLLATLPLLCTLSLSSHGFAQPPRTGSMPATYIAPANSPPPTHPPVCDLEPDQVEEVKPLLGTQCAIRVQAKDTALARTAVRAAMAEIARVQAKFDATSRESEIASINADAGTEEVLVSEETHLLLQRCLDLCRDTAGAFDLTVASFDYLWNFSARPFIKPLPDEVAARRALTGCRQVAIKPNRAVRILQPGVRLTFEHIVQGHAIERAAEVLRDKGIENFRIRLGNDTYVQGHAGTRHWYVAVPHPRNLQESMVQLYLGSQSAATRSDSDRYTLKNGHRYHDVLDPRTGNPVEGVVQTTVIAADPELADALSTAMFVLGPKAGLAMLARHKNVEGFLVDQTGKVFASPGMTEYARLPTRIAL
jgi:thiamine biosynthesis lipoprotein